MGKQKIVYIGPKEFKRDTVAGTRQIFPRHKAIEVSDEVAAVLLRFNQVFVEADKLKGALEKQDAEEKAKAEAAAVLAEEEAKRQAELDMTVTINGDIMDLSKMTGPKLATLIESLEGLNVDPQQSQEKVDDFRKRVRDAIRAMDKNEVAGEDE